MRTLTSFFFPLVVASGALVAGCPNTVGTGNSDGGTISEGDSGSTPPDASVAKKDSAGVMLVRTSMNGSPTPFTYASAEFYKAANDGEQVAINQRVQDFKGSFLLPDLAPGTCAKEPEAVKDPPGLPKPLNIGAELPAKDAAGNVAFNLSVQPGAADAFYYFTGSLDLFGFKGALSVPTTFSTDLKIQIAMGLKYAIGGDGGTVELKAGGDVLIPIVPTPPAGTTVVAHFAGQSVACKAKFEDIQLGFLRVPQVDLETKFGIRQDKTSIVTIDVMSLGSTPIDFGGAIPKWSFESILTSSIGANYYF